VSPKKFLQIGGVILLILGVLGFLVERPLGNDLIIFTPGENYAHVVLGIVALILAPAPLGELKRWVVALVGIVALYFAVAGFLVRGVPPMNYYGVANLELVDDVIHLVVGVWALVAAFGKKKMMA